jgi:hypothetical protein
MKLLGCIRSLLELSTVQEAKLELSDVEPVIRFERINNLSEQRRVHHQIVGVGGVHHWVWCGGCTPRCMRFFFGTRMSSFYMASSCSMLTGGGGGGSGGDAEAVP